MSHVQTFINHLCLLGWKGVTLRDARRHPVVTKFIDNMYTNIFKSNGNKTNSIDLNKVGSYMGAIEYAYAVISKKLSEFLNELNVNLHYSIHKELDYFHAQQLFSICEEINEEYIEKGIIDIICVFNDMAAIFNKHTPKFGVAFEDSSIERAIIQQYQPKKVMCIGSGGCTAFSMMNECISEIYIIDRDISQINLIKQKFEKIKELPKEDYLKILDDLPLGAYEETFLLGNKLGMDKVTSDAHLGTVFSERALNGKGKSDFTTIFDKARQKVRSVYFKSLLDGNPLHCKVDYMQNNFEQVKKFDIRKVKFHRDTVYNFLKSTDIHLDLIHLSNIFDWNNNNDANYNLVKLLELRTIPGSLVTIRHINGFDPTVLMEKHSFVLHSEEWDDSMLYTTVIFKRV